MLSSLLLANFLFAGYGFHALTVMQNHALGSWSSHVTSVWLPYLVGTFLKLYTQQIADKRLIIITWVHLHQHQTLAWSLGTYKLNIFSIFSPMFACKNPVKFTMTIAENTFLAGRFSEQFIYAKTMFPLEFTI